MNKDPMRFGLTKEQIEDQLSGREPVSDALKSGLLPYLTDSDGRIYFKKSEYDDIRRYFAYAGININDVKTEGDYRKARRQASPFLFQYMSDYLQKRVAEDPQKKRNLEYQALMAIVEGDYKKSDALMKKAALKRRMKGDDK